MFQGPPTAKNGDCLEYETVHFLLLHVYNHVLSKEIPIVSAFGLFRFRPTEISHRLTINW
jgi:hypothetical protein